MSDKELRFAHERMRAAHYGLTSSGRVDPAFRIKTVAAVLDQASRELEHAHPEWFAPDHAAGEGTR